MRAADKKCTSSSSFSTILHPLDVYWLQYLRLLTSLTTPSCQSRINKSRNHHTALSRREQQQLCLPFGWWQHRNMWSCSGQYEAQSRRSTLSDYSSSSSSAGNREELRRPSPCRKQPPLKETEREGERHRGFVNRAEEDEEAVGRGRFRRGCTEAKTNRTVCVIQVSRCRSGIRGVQSQCVCVCVCVNAP